MFKRLILEEWHQAVPIIAFVLTFSVFLVFLIRALRMKKEHARHMAELPLQTDDQIRAKKEK